MGMLTGELTERLSARVGAVCPVLRVRCDRTWEPKPEATHEQRAAAQAILDAFDPVAEQAAVEAEKKAENERQAAIKTLAEWMRTNGAKSITDLAAKVPVLEAELAKAEMSIAELSKVAVEGDAKA